MTVPPSAESMRRVVVQPDGVQLETVAVPAPGPHEALIETRVVGICGSDLHAFRGRHPFVPLPYLPGHEVVGVIRTVGSAVTAVAAGQRVTAEPPLPCWDCKMCRSGRENLCENLQFFGCGYTQGGMADLFTVDAGRLHLIPDGLDDVTAALIEPLSTPVHAAGLVGGIAGRAVVILGAGTIGLLMLAVARYQRASRIVVTDVLASKRERALRLGADAVVDPADRDATDEVRSLLGETADLVFDCVAIQQTVTTAISLADKGGTVVIVGVPEGEVTVPLPVIQDHQIRVQGSATYLPADFAESITMLLTGAVNTAEIITAELPLEQAADGFALASAGQQVKVVLTSKQSA